LPPAAGNFGTADLDTACEIAEFGLNVLPMQSLPSWIDLERLVEEHFKVADEGSRFSLMPAGFPESV
jgi:hypothetical protein